MNTIKSAISLPIELFHEADEISKKTKLSRSRLFALAIREFINKYKNKKMLEELNLVYQDHRANPMETELTRRWFEHQNKNSGTDW